VPPRLSLRFDVTACPVAEHVTRSIESKVIGVPGDEPVYGKHPLQ
jgi:metal-sulfur cluster biosynthetic enzyme